MLDKLTKLLVPIGRAHQWLRWPILALLMNRAAGLYALTQAKANRAGAVLKQEWTVSRRSLPKRAMAMALCLCMTLTLLPVNAFAAEKNAEIGLTTCTHVHDAAVCGYVAPVPGAPCAHVCDETCAGLPPAAPPEPDNAALATGTDSTLSPVAAYDAADIATYKYLTFAEGTTTPPVAANWQDGISATTDTWDSGGNITSAGGIVGYGGMYNAASCVFNSFSTATLSYENSTGSAYHLGGIAGTSFYDNAVNNYATGAVAIAGCNDGTVMHNYHPTGATSGSGGGYPTSGTEMEIAKMTTAAGTEGQRRHVQTDQRRCQQQLTGSQRVCRQQGLFGGRHPDKRRRQCHCLQWIALPLQCADADAGRLSHADRHGDRGCPHRQQRQDGR